MVVERNFHRVYDLTRRVMPDWDDERDALSRETQRPLCCAIAPVASASSAPSGWPITIACASRRYRVCWRRQEEGLVVPVNVEALGEMWLHHKALAQLETAPGGKLTASHSAVLSPSTRWSGIGNALSSCSTSAIAECYTPAPKRQYGYFVLPLLHRENWSGGWTVKYIAKAGSWRSSPCGWRRGEDHPWSGAGAAPGD